MVAIAEEVALVAVAAPEGLAGRRFSLRYLGKPRPSYTPAKPDPKPMKVEGRPKKQGGRKKVRVESGAKVTNGASACSSVPAWDPNRLIALMNAGESSGVDGEGKGTVEADGVDGSGRDGSENVRDGREHARVKETIRTFNKHYLHFVQEEEQRYKKVEAILSKAPSSLKPKAKKKNDKKAKHDLLQIPEVLQSDEPEVGVGVEQGMKRASKRPDLKAISKMIDNGTILFPEKRIGHLPGIDVGHEFFSRAEMVVVGIHKHWLNGIDYMGLSYAKKEEYKCYRFPLAVCVVLSGMYEDDLDNCDDVVYTGQGGNDLLGNKHQIGDQKMERGNLALKNNMDCGVPVRVVRGHVSPNSYCGKVYTYDGLYKVVKYWGEKGVSGFTIFKYRLLRIEGQPPLTAAKVIFTRAQAPKCSSEIRGLVIDDIAEGTEKSAIPVTNMVDDPPLAPINFKYIKSLEVSKNVNIPVSAVGCNCKGECNDPRVCRCAKLNGGDFPYVRKNGGRLIEAKAVVYECGPNCGCNHSCVNRTSQKDLKHRLEVYRTPKKGWAVRSWDTIPPGSPVCEYIGILTKSDEIESVLENNYIFDIDCLQTMNGLDGRERRPGDVSMLMNFDDKKMESPEYCIDAGSVGNVARFINHSCRPNLFVQCVLSSHHDIKMARVMLFAADTIPPLQELTYDYGYALDSVVGPDGGVKRLACYCGAPDCRKRLY